MWFLRSLQLLRFNACSLGPGGALLSCSRAVNRSKGQSLPSRSFPRGGRGKLNLWATEKGGSTLDSFPGLTKHSTTVGSVRQFSPSSGTLLPPEFLFLCLKCLSSPSGHGRIIDKLEFHELVRAVLANITPLPQHGLCPVDWWRSLQAQPDPTGVSSDGSPPAARGVGWGLCWDCVHSPTSPSTQSCSLPLHTGVESPPQSLLLRESKLEQASLPLTRSIIQAFDFLLNWGQKYT